MAVLATSVHFGGIERVLLGLLEHMDPDVELVPILFTRTDAADTGLFDRLRSLGVSPHTIAVNRSRAKYWNPVRNVVETLAFFKTRSFDVIHSHGYRADFLALIAAKRFGIPLVSTCHGFIANDRRLRFYNWLDVRMLRHFTRVIAVSAQMKDDLVSCGLDPAKTQVITNAVDCPQVTDGGPHREQIRAALGIRHDDFVFGSVGRLSEEKGLHHLLHAARGLSADQRWRLVLVGDGERRRTLEQLAHDLGIAARVDFVGFQREPGPWYAAMDAFVLASVTEGTPLALLEAMAAGLPVVATAVGGVPAVVTHRQNGLLVPAGDPARLQDAMYSLLADSHLRCALAGASVRTIRDAYDLRTWSQTMRELYLGLAAKGVAA